MGKHKDWRKVAKRERRRRIRTHEAKKRDKFHNNEDYVKEQEIMHAIELEMIEKTNTEENEKWLNAERVAIHQWKILQEKQKMLQQARLQIEAKLKLEWEIEKQKRKAEAERLKAVEDENRIKQEKYLKALDEFMSGDSVHPPEELLISRETRPSAELCPFFSKTSCCRFGDQCSRNHRYPGISSILLATNFYHHFGMNNANPTEYDTDIMLEYEDNETYKEFKEFFYDVLQEFEKFGKIIHFKVCNNFEKHLRGNVYVQYEQLRCAVAAYNSLHTRWYGGRQLSLQFCQLPNWKNALCGMQFNKRCPKGRNCNYLHVFRNPDNLFIRYDTGERNAQRSPSRSWRWSESPPVDIPRRSRKSDRNKDRRKNYVKDKEYSDDSCSEDDTKRDDKKYGDKRKRNNDNNRQKSSKRGSYTEKKANGNKYYDDSNSYSDNTNSSDEDRNIDDSKLNRASNRKSEYTRKRDDGSRRSRNTSSYKRKSHDGDGSKYYDDSDDSYSDSDSNSDYDSTHHKSCDRKYDNKRKSVDGKCRSYRKPRKRGTVKRKYKDNSDTNTDNDTDSSDKDKSNDEDSDTSRKYHDKRQRDNDTSKHKFKRSDENNTKE